MQCGYFLCHGKAQAVALRPVAGVPLIELLKDMAAGLGVHTAAMVSDSHNRSALLAVQCYAYGSVLRAELGGIIQQIQPDLLYQSFAAVVGAGGQLGLKLQRLIAPLLPGHKDALAQLLIQRKVCTVGQNGLCLDTIQEQHTAGKLCQPPALIADDLQILALLLWGDILVQQQVGKAADADDGRLELMGKVIYKILAQQLRAGKLLRRFVEGCFELPDLGRLIPVGSGLQAHGEVPCRQPVHRLYDVFDRFY